MIYRKYAWPTKSQFISDMESAGLIVDSESVNCVFISRDGICLSEDENGVCTNFDSRFAVDIDFLNNPPESFTQYEVWPKPPGVQTMSGYEDYYLSEFCKRNPNDPFCTLATPTE